MRELLQEAAKWMDEVLNKSGHSNIEAFMLLDEGKALLTRITAALAEPEPDAKWESIISKIRATDSKGEYRLDYWSAQKLIEEFAEQHAEAVALIEDYGRRVPGVMLEELAIEILNLADLTLKSGWQKYVKNLLTEIFAKHGVKVEDVK